MKVAVLVVVVVVVVVVAIGGPEGRGVQVFGGSTPRTSNNKSNTLHSSSTKFLKSLAFISLILPLSKISFGSIDTKRA